MKEVLHSHVTIQDSRWDIWITEPNLRYHMQTCHQCFQKLKATCLGQRATSHGTQVAFTSLFDYLQKDKFWNELCDLALKRTQLITWYLLIKPWARESQIHQIQPVHLSQWKLSLSHVEMFQVFSFRWLSFQPAKFPVCLLTVVCFMGRLWGGMHVLTYFMYVLLTCYTDEDRTDKHPEK